MALARESGHWIYLESPGKKSLSLGNEWLEIIKKNKTTKGGNKGKVSKKTGLKTEKLFGTSHHGTAEDHRQEFSWTNISKEKKKKKRKASSTFHMSATSK